MSRKFSEERITEETLRIRKQEEAFATRGGKTIETQPLTMQERSAVDRGYKMEEELGMPMLPKHIETKIRQMGELALQVLNTEERSELYAYLDAVRFRKPKLGNIINPLIDLLDPEEDVPRPLSLNEYKNLIGIIESHGKN
jgi:hypothetical protein